MTATRRTKWVECRGKCEICQHSGWCTRSADGEVVKCMRVASAHPIKQKDGTVGWLHPAGSGGGDSAKSHERGGPPRPRLSRVDLAEWAKRLKADLVPNRLARFAARMGLSIKALEAYGVGFHLDWRAFSFPMVDGACKVIGFRLRSENPNAPPHERAKCIPGSRNGLFVPANFDQMAAPIPDAVCAACDLKDGMPLVILAPEGPTDAAAAFDLGYCAIGRPSCNGGSIALRELLHAGPARDVVIFADRDETKYLPDGTPFWPGLEGAVKLAEHLHPIQKEKGAPLRFMMPPAGTKDVRDWLQSGVGPIVFAGRVRAASIVSDFWLDYAQKRLEFKRRDERRAPAA